MISEKKPNIAIILSAGSSGLGVVRSLHANQIKSIVICMSKKEDVIHSRIPIKKIVVDQDIPDDEQRLQYRIFAQTDHH